MKIKKIANILADVVLTVLFVIMAISIVWIVFFRTADDAPRIFGVSMYVVATGSMEPEIHVGDIIFDKEYEGQDLEVGQVITYYGKSGSLAGKRITHKIIEVDNVTGKIITQGVANSTPDPAITKDDVLGVMLYRTVFLGKAYGFLMKPIGFILIIIVPMTAFIIKEVIQAIITSKKQKDEELQEEIDEQARKWIAERELKGEPIISTEATENSAEKAVLDVENFEENAVDDIENSEERADKNLEDTEKNNSKQ